MPSTFTPSLNLEKPATGEQDSTWGVTLDSNWDKVDARFGGSYSTSMSDADFSITQANAANANITATGAITAGRNFIFPAGVGVEWEFINNTTGGFIVTVKTSGGTGVVVRQNERMVVASDGTNCYDAGLGTVRRDGLVNWVIAGGTADALTAAYTPANTVLADGQEFYVRAASANATTTPTLAIDGLTARTITKNGGVALVAGDIFGAGHELILRYKLANTRLELMNPALSGASSATTLAGTNVQQFLTAGGFAGNGPVGAGYYKFPGGVIVQWGNVVVGAGTASVTFTYPIAFPTVVESTSTVGNGGAAATAAVTASPSMSSALIVNPSPNPAQTVFVIAIGH